MKFSGKEPERLECCNKNCETLSLPREKQRIADSIHFFIKKLLILKSVARVNFTFVNN